MYFTSHKYTSIYILVSVITTGFLEIYRKPHKKICYSPEHSFFKKLVRSSQAVSALEIGKAVSNILASLSTHTQKASDTQTEKEPRGGG